MPITIAMHVRTALAEAQAHLRPPRERSGSEPLPLAHKRRSRSVRVLTPTARARATRDVRVLTPHCEGHCRSHSLRELPAENLWFRWRLVRSPKKVPGEGRWGGARPPAPAPAQFRQWSSDRFHTSTACAAAFCWRGVRSGCGVAGAVRARGHGHSGCNRCLRRRCGHVCREKLARTCVLPPQGEAAPREALGAFGILARLVKIELFVGVLSHLDAERLARRGAQQQRRRKPAPAHQAFAGLLPSTPRISSSKTHKFWFPQRQVRGYPG